MRRDRIETGIQLSTAGMSRRGRHERGTVLLMVVGVLALLSIIAVAYVAVGQADRRGSSALVSDARLSDNRDELVDYVRDVLAQDLFTTTTFFNTPPGGGFGAGAASTKVRESWDAPGAAMSRVTGQPPTAAIPNVYTNRNNPPGMIAGANDRMIVSVIPQNGALNPSNAVQFDPAGFGDDPWLASTLPEALRVPGTQPPNANQAKLDYRNANSWRSISNISPNGLFVNLGMLRPTNENQNGNFNAPPGTQAAVNGSPDPALRSAGMSRNLTLLDKNGLPYPLGQSNAWPPDTVQLKTDPNVPAFWSVNQEGLYRPANEFPRAAGYKGPESLLYMPYQYADADGDGMFDSRWFELLRLSNTGAVSNASATPNVPGAATQVRFFAAARIIDLSGLVNVNTAYSFGRGFSAERPDRTNPAGAFPSDIDLERLLTLVDAYEIYGFAYNAYYTFNPAPTPATNADYTDTGPRGAAGEYNVTAARAVGLSAFESLRETFAKGAPPYSPDPYVADRESGAISPIDRAEHYRTVGADPSGGRMDFTAGTRLAFGFNFDLSNAAELFSFRGINDSTRTCQLEQALGGRNDNPDYQHLSPLRDNRPKSLEKGGLSRPNDANARASDEALLHAQTDIRGLLTPISGARTIRSAIITGNDTFPSLSTAAAASEFPMSFREALELATQANNPDVKPLFKAYANALVPRSDETNFAGWDPNSAQFPQLRSTFYGWRGAELALRCAGFMTVNAIDAFDQTTVGSYLGERVRCANLFLRQNPGTIAPGPANQITLNLNDPATTPARLPATAVPSHSPYIRIFGTEAQPFMVQAATFLILHDAPPESERPSETDEGWEWTDSNADGKVTIDEVTRWGEVTIDGSVNDTNRDFIGQVFAVQLYNPFAFPIQLDDYLVQFGDGMWSLPTYTLNSRDTVTVYTTEPSDETTLENRLARVAGATPGITVPAGTMKSWIERQLGATGAAGGSVTIKQMNQRYDITTGTATAVIGGGVLDVLTPRAAGMDDRNRSVLLWRRLQAGAGGGGGSLLPQDLMLADRLRDPSSGRPTLDRRPSGRVVVSATQAGVDPRLGDADPNEIEDNTGLTISLWGTIRRPIDPGSAAPGAPHSIPTGAIPAFCIEVKHQAANPTAGWGPLNLDATDEVGDPDSLDRGNFRGDLGGDKIDRILTQPNLIKSLAENAERKSVADRAGQTATPIAASGDNHSGPVYNLLYPEIFLRNDRGIGKDAAATPNPTFPTIRLGDALLPLAIGPWWEPPSTGATTLPTFDKINDINEQWTSLSEALALALDYDTPKPVATDPIFQMYNRFGKVIVDRGHLRLDAFVPFYNGQAPGTNTAENLPIFDAAANSNDLVREPGIPMALGILSNFRALENGGDRARSNGVININTAPLQVLRTLPMLSPLKDSWLTEQATSQPGGFLSPGVLAENIGVTTQLFDPQSQRYDAAATLAAYRDRTWVWSRPLGLAGAAPTNSAVPLSFIDQPADAGTIAQPNGRQLQTMIPGLREGRGFHSVGEIMCALLRDTNAAHQPSPPTDPLVRADLSIDRFARDGRTIGFDDTSAGQPTLSGLDSSLYPDPSNSTVYDRSNDIADDYQEKLTIANAVLNSISVRSDVFCCWFLVQGYRQSDVEGLAPSEPMVPSIQRRYMMIVDRSNCVSKGDKPRILMLKEVPVN